jgi:serine/threonine protein kinase
MGTPYYMAPEVINRERLVTQSDMWSLGVAMYEMLVGYPPFVRATTQEHLFSLINTSDY